MSLTSNLYNHRIVHYSLITLIKRLRNRIIFSSFIIHFNIVVLYFNHRYAIPAINPPTPPPAR